MYNIKVLSSDEQKEVYLVEITKDNSTLTLNVPFWYELCDIMQEFDITMQQSLSMEEH